MINSFWFQFPVLEVSIWMTMLGVWNVKLELTVLEMQHQVVQTVQTAKLLTRVQQVKKVIAHGVSTLPGLFMAVIIMASNFMAGINMAVFLKNRQITPGIKILAIKRPRQLIPLHF
jgi:hypothetical protein